MGKSASSATSPRTSPGRTKLPVAFFSLEMSETELAHRFIATRAADRHRPPAQGPGRREDWPRVLRACNELDEAPLWIDDSSDLSLLDLRAKCRRLAAARAALGLVIVDYIQLMRADDPRANRVEQVGQMSRGLKILARELEVPVIGLSQLSRAPEQRPRQGADPLRPSRVGNSIEQDSDIVAFIYRDEYYNERGAERPGEAELIIAKHRNGPIGTVPLAFLEQYPRFVNLAGSYGGGERRGRAERSGDGPAAASTSLEAASSRAAATPGAPARGGELGDRPACTLGVCDGSGWIVGPEDVARPCECREAADRAARPAASRRSLPKRYATSASTARRSPTWRSTRTAQSVARCASSTEAIDDNLDAGPRPLADGRRRHRQDDAGDARLEGARSRPAARVAIYSLPRLLARIRRTYDAERRRGLLPRVLRAADLGRPAPPRRPRRREAHRLGARAALRDRRRALRSRSARWS